jgi:DNA invertase Pin-like site-specific DNA recombinase
MSRQELLTLSEEHDITLHGQANRRDLSDPDDRFFLRIEVAHACSSSDDTSRRLRDAWEDRARDGRPHSSGQRPLVRPAFSGQTAAALLADGDPWQIECPSRNCCPRI